MAPQWSQKNKRRAAAASLVLLALLWVTLAGPSFHREDDAAEQAITLPAVADNEFTPPGSLPPGRDSFRPEHGPLAVAGAADSHAAANAPASPGKAMDREWALVVPRGSRLTPEATSSNGALPGTMGPGRSAGGATGSPAPGGGAAARPGAGMGAGGTVGSVAAASGAVAAASGEVASASGVAGAGDATGQPPNGARGTNVAAFVPGAGTPAAGAQSASSGGTAPVLGLDSVSHRGESLEDIAANGGGPGGDGLGAFPPPPENGQGAPPSDGTSPQGGGTPSGQASVNANAPVNQPVTVPEPTPFLLLVGPALYFWRRRLSL